jgi:SAM-dependent methyltransferase
VSRLDQPRTAYDPVAALYAELFGDVLDRLPVERAMLASFVELVSGPIADVGCGPGHVTAHLHTLGATAFGVDISPAMVALARQAHPDLRFDEGSMFDLDIADEALGGVLAYYSTIHTAPQDLAAVFGEFARVLAPGGHLLLGFLACEDPLPQEYDHKVELAYRWSPGSLAELLRQAGFVVVATMVREPRHDERVPQGNLLVRKGTQPAT